MQPNYYDNCKALDTPQGVKMAQEQGERAYAECKRKYENAIQVAKLKNEWMLTEMTDWFKTHVFLAAWASPIIALVGMLLKKQPTSGPPVNWPRVMIFVGWLTSLAVLVTPGIEPIARGTFAMLAAMGFGYLITESRH